MQVQGWQKKNSVAMQTNDFLAKKIKQMLLVFDIIKQI